MRHQRKPSITSTYYAISLLLVVLLLHPPVPPSRSASLSSWPQRSSSLPPSRPSLFSPLFTSSFLPPPHCFLCLLTFSPLFLYSSLQACENTCFLWPVVWMWKLVCEHKVLVRIHGYVQSYILAFQWKMVIRQPIRSLMARATLTKQKKK